MEDILLSKKQYQALLSRLDEINSDVTSIKLNGLPETIFLDNYNLLKLLQVTNRTIQRWRKSGRLPYIRLGKKLYYRADVILDNFTIRPSSIKEIDQITQPVFEPKDEEEEMACKQCPLYLVLIS